MDNLGNHGKIEAMVDVADILLKKGNLVKPKEYCAQILRSVSSYGTEDLYNRTKLLFENHLSANELDDLILLYPFTNKSIPLSDENVEDPKDPVTSLEK